MTKLILNGPEKAPLVLLAHGAGAGGASDFLTEISALLAVQHIATARFDFGYMAKRQIDGRRRPPPKAETLYQKWRWH